MEANIIQIEPNCITVNPTNLFEIKDKELPTQGRWDNKIHPL
jgi:hypothetical protein